VERERVRLKGHPSLTFPKRDVASLTHTSRPDGRERYELEIAFMTLFGVDSPLPPHVTEDIVRGSPQSDAARDFLDIFNHRLLSLLFRSWGRYRLHVGSPRWGEDPLTRQLDALLDLPALPDALRHAGLLFQRPRSAEGLLTLLRGYFPGLGFALEQCVPRLVEVPTDQRSRLGARACQLGEDLLLGEQVLDASGAFRLRVGPVPLERQRDFRPGEPGAALLTAAVEAWCQEPLDWEIEVLMVTGDASQTRLSGDAPAARLGVDTWLGRPAGAAASITLRPGSEP
jgi:type VI secretion system protein ImpH